MAFKIEKAKIGDAPQIHKLINHFAGKNEMLARPLSEIYENIRDYFAVRQTEQVIACAALHINWVDLAEIKSLAVSKENQKQGLGDQLIAACLEEAKGLGIPTVFCLTYRPKFFEQCGFSLIDRSELPHKVWGECYRCPQFPNCDEVALIYHFETPSKV
jgi:amino-acid N-acetyltransferase|tara:strand:+ start:101 stop:577 length:477 start_codon:yes stop_codon:yes gene_type:complete